MFAAKYAVPIIGDLTLIPSLSSEDFKTALLGGITALVLTCSIPLEALETLFLFDLLGILTLLIRIL